MVERSGVVETSNGKRRKITHSESPSSSLLPIASENESDEEPDLDDFAHFDASDDEGWDDISWRLTTNRTHDDDRESARRSLTERYLRSNSGGISSDCTLVEAEAARFEWAYAVEEGPDFPPTPVWEIKVTRGREWDVLCSVLEIARQFPDDYDILSASSNPSVPGAVFIECTFESVARRLLLHVAFTRRLVAPKQISSEAFKRSLLLTSPPIEEGSWVRLTSPGQYRHDLAWVQGYDAETRYASLYLVPRWRVDEGLHQNSGGEKACSVRKSRSRQSLLQYHLDDSLDPAVQCVLYGEYFHFGFLVCREPLVNLAIHRIQSSVEELDRWTRSPMYDFASHTMGREHSDHVLQIAGLFTRGVNRLLAAAHSPLPLQVGHRVHFLTEGGGFGAVGWVTSLNKTDRSVQVNICDPVNGGSTTSVRWPITQTALNFRVGDEITVMKGIWAGLRARVARIDLSKAEIDITCEVGKPKKLSDGNAPVMNSNNEDNIFSLVNIGHMSIVEQPRFSLITLPMASVCPQPPMDASVAATPAPSRPLITRDPYVQMEVRAFDRNIGLFYGTVIGTSADHRLVSVRSEGRAVNTIELMSVENVKERHTELSLAEYSRTPQVKIHALRTQRDIARSSVNLDDFSCLPDAQEAWPEVFTENRSRTDSDLPSSASDRSSGDVMVSHVPLDWLLQSALENRYLDVVVRGGTTKISAEYNNRVGVIRSLEKVKRGKRGSVKIRFGRGLCTDRWIPVRDVFPLTTTEYEGVTSRALAKSILDVMGIYVVIIGPDTAGRRYFVGRTGFTSWEGKVNLDGALIVFPVTSLCRSDPVAK
ncbi:hypothetical protein R3P38DRAFT_3254029 [Favolaschia claudopus]|uniref:NGN domain-containing protein n=1 Tax=Favolaschia claudopus TaxID=2862362 RepID=A0AAW0DYC8_9AGAR